MSVVIRDLRLVRKAILGPVVPASGRHVSQSGSSLLRWSLVAADAVALMAAWTAINLLLPASSSTSMVARILLSVLPLVAIGHFLIAKHQLYCARVATMRTVEQASLARVCALLVAAAAAVDLLHGAAVMPARLVAGGLLSFVGLSVARTAYQGWLNAARRAGRFTRPVIIVGVDERTAEIYQICADEAALGFEVVGVLGSRADTKAAGLEALWLGGVDEVTEVVARVGATGVIVSSAAIDSSTLNILTRSLLDQHCHVHLSTGIAGIDQRRLHPMHLGYEPLLYLEPPELTRPQLKVKRALDIVISALVMLLVIPVLAISALAIKLSSDGPVLFRQQRVGRGGRLFTVLKLRTMSVGAEDQLAALLPQNERDGPLFKMDDDPRVTRVGRILRSLSIDELPQLWNVFRGEMSLVGPRPALPSEAVNFGERLQLRTQVLPGVTGLWQVESRDSASFHSYERLDLFYVENWSISLDVMVIIATVEDLLAKLVSSLFPQAARPRGSSAVRFTLLTSVFVVLALMFSYSSSGANRTETTGAGGVISDPGPGDPSSSQPVGPGAVNDTRPGDRGTIHDTVPSRSKVVRYPVALGATADFGEGVTARLIEVDAVEAQAFVPGEVSGPGVAITIQITNGSSAAINLDHVTVDLVDARDRPSTLITSRTYTQLEGDVAPGGTREGTYLFTIAAKERAGVDLRVTYAGPKPTVVFRGSLLIPDLGPPAKDRP